MTTLPLHARDRQLFVENDGESGLLDTGAPAGFGMAGEVSLAGETFPLARGYLGLDAAALSGFVGVDCVG